MRCRNCDYTNTEEATVCANCGVPLERPTRQRPQGSQPNLPHDTEPKEEDKGHEGLAFLGGFVVGALLAGAVVFFVPKMLDPTILPNNAKAPNTKVEETQEGKAETAKEEKQDTQKPKQEEVVEKSEEPKPEQTEEIKTETPTTSEEPTPPEEPKEDSLTVGQALDNLFVTKPVEVVVPTPDLVAVFAGADKEELLLLPCAKAGEDVDLGDVKIKCEDLGVSTYGEKLGLDNNTEVDTFGCVKVLIQNTTSHDIPFGNLMVYLFEEEFGQINIADTCVVAGTTTTTGVFLQDLGDTLKVGDTINMLIPYSKKYEKGIAYISLVNQDTNGKGTVVKLHE